MNSIWIQIITFVFKVFLFQHAFACEIVFIQLTANFQLCTLYTRNHLIDNSTVIYKIGYTYNYKYKRLLLRVHII